MTKQATIQVEDLTEKTPASGLAAIVHFGSKDRYVEVLKSGTVRLVSPTGTVSAQFKEHEQRDILRQNYIQTLLTSGVEGEDLEQALESIARVDRRLAEEPNEQENLADLERRTKA